MMLFLLACDTSETESKAVLFTEGDLSADIANYLDWAQPGGWAGPAISCEPSHGPLVDIWYNDSAFEALGRNDDLLPEGAALVLQAYNADGTMGDMTAMRKVADFAPESGDWFWGQFSSDGAALASGALTECASCHVAGHDYIQFPNAPRVLDAANCP